MLTDDGIRNPVLTGMLWMRRLFPYAVFLVGAVLGAAAVIRIFRATTQQAQLRELAWLGASLLLFWLSHGLLERNERSWKVYQATGAALTGAMGAALVHVSFLHTWYWLTVDSSYGHELGISWFTTGLALIIWCIGLLANSGGACFLWQVGILPIAFFSFWGWKHLAVSALAMDHSFLVVLSTFYFAVSMGVLLLLSRHAYRRDHPVEKTARKSWQPPRSFPSKYHELLERGRLCELFEVPCAQPCPLPTAIVAKYQKRRIQYRLYPEILEPFEKAYAILVTPQKRELCKVAHEILQAKEKQLGPKRYQEMEVYLWRTLWERLQDGEYKGDPQKALQDKNRLLKEITPPETN